MLFRVRWVGIAVAAMLTVASACHAADSDQRRASIGGMIGGSLMTADADYSAGAAPRMAFSASFRYQVRSWLRWQVSPGFLWVAYDNNEPIPFTDPNYPADATKAEALTLVVPVSAQAQLLVTRGLWCYHLGAGPGLYRVWLENRRKVLQDPVSHKRHRGVYAGLSGEIGVERYLKSLTDVSIEGTLSGHLVFAQRDAQFPSGYDSNLFPITLRLGANYHFSPGRKKSAPAAPAPDAPPEGGAE